MSIHKTNIIAFILAAILVLLSLYFEFWLGLDPCPLCIMQRLMMILVTIGFFIGIFLFRQKKFCIRLHSIVMFILAATGTLFAGRQIWLQHLPKDLAPACGAGLNYMLKNLPISQTIKLVFQGSGDCAKVPWTFLHLSMAEWALAFFVLFVVTAIINFCRAPGM